MPRADGSFKVLTPNCLLIGRSTNKVPDDSQLVSQLKKSERYQLIQQITVEFWKRWAEEVTPENVVGQKWHEKRRNLQVGDVVLIHESSPVKGSYVLGKVEAVKSSKDELIRSCIVGYRIPNSRDPLGKYSGGRKVSVSRSVQRLTLLLPIEDQNGEVTISGDQILSGDGVKEKV